MDERRVFKQIARDAIATSDEPGGVISQRHAEDEGLLGRHGLLDRGLFARSDAYRVAVAKLNLFTVLIDDGDTHEGQFLAVRQKGGLLLLSVDNNMAFGGPKNPSLTFEDDWSRLHVRRCRERRCSA